jgi:hypothetical protein
VVDATTATAAAATATATAESSTQTAAAAVRFVERVEAVVSRCGRCIGRDRRGRVVVTIVAEHLCRDVSGGCCASSGHAEAGGEAGVDGPTFLRFLLRVLRGCGRAQRGRLGRGLRGGRGRDLRRGRCRGCGFAVVRVDGVGVLRCGHDRASSYGSESHDEFEIGVEQRRPSGMTTDLLADDRYPRRSSDEQHAREGRRLGAGTGDRTIERTDRVGDAGANRGLELVTRDAHLRVQSGRSDGHGRFRVGRQRLFGSSAVGAQLHERAPGLGVGRIQFAQSPVERVIDVGNDHLIEIDTTQPFEPFGRSEDLRATFVAPHDGRVERPAAEVVDGDDVAGHKAAETHVVQCGGDRFGHERHTADPGQSSRFSQEIELVVAPGRGMGQDHLVGSRAGRGRSRRNDVTQEVSHQRFRAVRLARHHHRGGVTEPALALADTRRRIGQHLLLGALADDDVVAGERDDRRHRRRVRAERQHRATRAAADRGRGPRGSEIDAEPVRAHGRSTQLPLSPSTPWLESATRMQS